jgi:hypothetical protein
MISKNQPYGLKLLHVFETPFFGLFSSTCILEYIDYAISKTCKIFQKYPKKEGIMINLPGDNYAI